MKKITLTVLAILFLFPGLVNAQLFSKVFTNTTNVDAFKVGLASTSNSILTGLTEIDVDANFRETIHLIVVATNGNLQESFLYETNDSSTSINCQQILKISDDVILIAGNYKSPAGISFPFIMSIDGFGSINWAKKVDKPSDYSPDVTILSDNSVLCIIRYNDGQTHQVYCKIDDLGNLSSLFEIDDPFKIKKDILVKSNSFDILFLDGNLLNISNDLSTVNWQRKYENVIGVTINSTANGNYIIATCQVAFPGYLTVTRTDSLGDVLWCKYIESWQGAIQNQGTIFDVTGIHSIKEDDNGNIIVYGNSEGGLGGTFQITLDANGIYVSNYRTTSYHNKIMTYGNSACLLFGFTSASHYNTSGVVLQRLENSSSTDCDLVMSFNITDGNQVMPTPNTTVFTPSAALTLIDVSVQNTNIPVEVADYCNIPLAIADKLHKVDIRIFPVPASDYIEITSSASIREIKLYDIHGKIVIKTQHPKVNISSLASGTYIVEVIGVDGTVFRKVIKD